MSAYIQISKANRYIYIERERERERSGQKPDRGRRGESDDWDQGTHSDSVTGAQRES